MPRKSKTAKAYDVTALKKSALPDPPVHLGGHGTATVQISGFNNPSRTSMSASLESAAGVPLWIGSGQLTKTGLQANLIPEVSVAEGTFDISPEDLDQLGVARQVGKVR